SSMCRAMRLPMLWRNWRCSHRYGTVLPIRYRFRWRSERRSTLQSESWAGWQGCRPASEGNRFLTVAALIGTFVGSDWGVCGSDLAGPRFGLESCSFREDSSSFWVLNGRPHGNLAGGLPSLKG